MDTPGQWIVRPGQRRAFDKLILDLNSSVSETYPKFRNFEAKTGLTGAPGLLVP